MAIARTEATAVDVLPVSDAMNELPDIMADAALDGSASDSISSSIAATGNAMSAAGGRTRSATATGVAGA